jgi:hypothetical protein
MTETATPATETETPATVTETVTPMEKPARRPRKAAAKTTPEVPEFPVETNPAPEAVKLSGYRAHAVNPAPSAMVYFTAWILDNNPEFAPLADIDRGLLERFVTVASKDYRHYQASGDQKG